MPVFHDVALAIQSIFSEETDQLAKETGFIKRERKITGSRFIKTLMFGWMQNKSPSVEGLVRAGYRHNLHISAQGLDQRFTEKSADFVHCILEKALTKTIKSMSVDTEILNRFSAVYIADCSQIVLPNDLHTIWQGTGGRGSTSKSGLKIDASIELKTGELTFGVLEGKHADSCTPIAEKEYKAGALHLRDLGYFNLARMKKQDKRNEYWLSRLQPRTKVFDELGQPIDLLTYLNTQPCSQSELNVTIGAEERVETRLFTCKLSQEVASRRRAKLKKNAQKKGRTPSAESLALCDWNLYVTNVEKEKLSIKECLILYRVRWQSELLFKLWKSHCQLVNSTSENSYRILCEIYTKLLIILVQHWIVLTGLWEIAERSLVKGVQMIREQSAHLAHVVNDYEQLVSTLKDISQRFSYGCSNNKRRKKLNTVDQMANWSA